MRSSAKKSLPEASINRVGRQGTRSFYIEKETLEKLQQRADQTKVSVNSLVNNLLKEYVDFLIPFDNYGYVLFCRYGLKDMLKRLPQDEVMKAGSECGKCCGLFWFDQLGNDISIDSIKEALRTSCDYSKWGHYSEGEKNGKKIISINHELGTTFSMYLKAYTEYLISLLPPKGRENMNVCAFEKCIILYL